MTHPQPDADDPTPPPAISVHRLQAWYVAGQNVLDLADFAVPPHTVVGLLGVNGAGKSLQEMNQLKDSFDDLS